MDIPIHNKVLHKEQTAFCVDAPKVLTNTEQHDTQGLFTTQFLLRQLLIEHFRFYSIFAGTAVNEIVRPH